MKFTPLLFCLGALLFFTISGCQSKKKEENKLWPVLPYLMSEVSAVDSSISRITKIITREDGGYDTVYIHRNDFRKEASDFLSLPDISSTKFAGDYKEEEIMDEGIQRFIVRQTPLKPEKQLIQSQEVLIKPALEGDQVMTILISTLQSGKDSSVQKRMIWNIGKSMQVTTIVQKDKDTEKINTYKITWGDTE
ncbi:MAG: hypothetical protein NVV59_09645 [Chitinophagaceae bacterium]|nr:hypothetical protein [Chitinophagaceae bacterium]